MIALYLGADDLIFGSRTPLALAAFFGAEKLQLICPDTEAKIEYLGGCRCALAGWEGELIYIDIPKNEI